jgi:hypothetical protein
LYFKDKKRGKINKERRETSQEREGKKEAINA